jgi:hypothetical protein
MSYLYLHNGDVDVLNLHWELGYMVDKHLSDLFVLETIKYNEINYSKQIETKRNKNQTWRLLVKKNELPVGFTQAYSKDKNGVEYIDFEYDRIPKPILDGYLGHFRLLKPTKSVMERISSVQLPQDCVAVHIRLNKQWIDHNRGSYKDVDDFVVEMKKELPGTNFFLSSCDDTVASIIHSQFPNRIIELPNKNNLSNIDAVAEMYLLSKPRKIIGSFGSTFTELAWWFGECKQTVKIIGKDWNKK